jgi:biotin transport system substrate-specific component
LDTSSFSPPDLAGLAFGKKLGIEKAWLVGVAPFIAASLIKNALGATLLPAIRRMFDRR